MHYKNGRPAKIGDHVVGTTFNYAAPGCTIAGTLVSLTPGPDACSAKVGMLVTVMVSDQIQDSSLALLGDRRSYHPTPVAVQGTEQHGSAGPKAATYYVEDYTECKHLLHAEDAAQAKDLQDEINRRDLGLADPMEAIKAVFEEIYNIGDRLGIPRSTPEQRVDTLSEIHHQLDLLINAPQPMEAFVTGLQACTPNVRLDAVIQASNIEGIRETTSQLLANAKAILGFLEPGSIKAELQIKQLLAEVTRLHTALRDAQNETAVEVAMRRAIRIINDVPAVTEEEIGVVSFIIERIQEKLPTAHQMEFVTMEAIDYGSLIDQSREAHEKIKGASGKSPDFENGYIQAHNDIKTLIATCQEAYILEPGEVEIGVHMVNMGDAPPIDNAHVAEGCQTFGSKVE